MKPRTIQQLAVEALLVQNASNLTGVAYGFSKALSELRNHLGGASYSVYGHPITLAWISKLSDLGGLNSHLPSEHWDALERLANEVTP